MNLLPQELILIEFAQYLVPIDKQQLRKTAKFFYNIFPYEKLTFDKTPLELPHIMAYKKFWTYSTGLRLAKRGQLEALKYFNDNWSVDEYFWNCLSSEDKIEIGSIENIERYESHRDELIYLSYQYTFDIGFNVCAGGHLHILKYIEDKNWGLETNAVITAAEHGHIEILKFIYSVPRWANNINHYYIRRERSDVFNLLDEMCRKIIGISK